MSAEKPGRVVLLDSYGLIYRAFFALPALTTSKGQPINAALGFANMLTRIISEEQPTYLIAAFDKGPPQARIDRFPEYKAHREATPDDLRSQFALVRKVLEAFGVPIVEMAGEEADDVIATLARKVEGKHEVRVITGDLDLLQIVDEHTTVVATRRGISDLMHYDRAAVRERYGLEPSQLPDYRGLKGDPSDNLPGIAGIGEKTASKLIAKAGSLDALLADPTLAGSPRYEQMLRDGAEIARTCRDVSIIANDLPIEFPWEAALFSAPDTARLAQLYRELEFKTLLSRLDLDAAAAEPLTDAGQLRIEGAYENYVAITDPPDHVRLAQALQALGSQPRLAFAAFGDTLGVAWGEGKALAFSRAALTRGEVRDAFAALAANVREFVAHDAKGFFGTFRAQRPADIASAAALAAKAAAPKRGKGARAAAQAAEPDMSMAMSFDMSGGADAAGTVVSAAGNGAATPGSEAALHEMPAPLLAPRPIADDTMVAAYLLTPTRAYLDIADALRDFLDAVVGDDAAAHADATWRLAIETRARLEERAQLHLYDDLELPIATLLARMEATGVAVDRDELAQLAVEIDASVERNRAEIYRLADEEFNLGSPQQLGRILFEKLALPGGKRNKTGWATGVDILQGLAVDHEIVARVLEYREVSKLKNTYVDVIPTLLDTDGRLRTVFNQTTTATGRLSSTNPNLQNIPVRGELGRRIRRAFTAGGAGRVLIAADYSQIELRLMAHLSEDAAMRTAFAEHLDIHDVTARKIFGLAEGQAADREQRRIAKSVNFGLLYGMSDFGLAQRLGISRGEAKLMTEAYFAQFPGVRGYLDNTVAEGRERGYVSTLYGRRRYLPDLRSRDHMARAAAEREATNAPLQGGAADLMKVAMLRVADALREHDARQLLQIHDEIVLEVAASELRDIATIVRREMERAMELSVPLEVSVKTGKTWYEVAAYDDELAGEPESLSATAGLTAG